MKASDHAEMQRSRILKAAERCFIEHGFHAASMTNISEKAEVSTGLIYRYFENKDAIILAIIDRQLEERRADISTLQTDSDFIARVTELFGCWLKSDVKVMNPVLFLEMSAEASRNSKIAQALGEADKICGEDFREWLRQKAKREGHEVSEKDIRTRSFALRCFIEGLAVRAVREPDIDASVLAESAKLFIPHMLSFRHI